MQDAPSASPDANYGTGDGQAGTAACPVVGIGASAGGLEALTAMFDDVDADIGMAFVVVLHLDPHHESMMAELIDRKTLLNVRQVRDGDAVRPGYVHIIPPGHGLRIENGRLFLSDFSEPRGVRRPIDDFFISLSEDQGRNAAGVILSGTGSDGSVGLRSIKECGGLCVAQSPDTARYDGMPISAASTGLVDAQLAPDDIVAKVRSFFDNQKLPQLQEADPAAADHIENICAHLSEALGHDFSGYKRTTLQRRIERRMQIISELDGAAYLDRIRNDSNECESLFRDLLINVTGFFRDPELFDVLRQRAIDVLVGGASGSDPIRVWVPGCSSGEEPYSLAMLFADASARVGNKANVQIFATDIDDQMLAMAREGRYPISAMADIPARYRDRFLTYSETHLKLAQPIRDMVRFSSHSLIRDPAFSRLDLLSCRNLMIYFGEEVQSAVIPLMHYSLKTGGYLFLGPSEGVHRRDDLFTTIDQKARLYRRRDAPVSHPIGLPARTTARAERPERRRQNKWEGGRDEIVSAPNPGAQRLLEHYVPPSVIVDSDGSILDSRGRLAKYLELRPGRGANDVLATARMGLREALGPLLREAANRRARVARPDVNVVSEFGRQPITLIADPLPDGTTLVVFVDNGRFEPDISDAVIDTAQADDRVHQLEEEVNELRQRLRLTVEELETANEELKSSNEEMMSMNEELQSTNEELTTVNDELKSKIESLGELNDDLRNFLDSTDLAVVVVDDTLRVRTFTPKARSIFPLGDADRGRRLTEVATSVLDLDLVIDVRKVMSEGVEVERLVPSSDRQAHFQMRVLPYRSSQGRIAGATLTFSNVTDLFTTRRALDQHRERLELALRIGGVGVWQYDFETGRVDLDEATRLMFSLPRRDWYEYEEVVGRILEEDRQAVRDALEQSHREKAPYTAIYRVGTDEDSSRWVKAAGRFIEGADGSTTLVGVVSDIDLERRVEQTRELMMSEMNHRVKNSFAVAAAVLAGSARDHDTVRGLADDAGGRIQALARAHAATQPEQSGKSRSLRELLETILEAHAVSNVVTLGEGDLVLPSERVTPLGLIVHEWMTNAMKYGGLSCEGGTLAVNWSLNQQANQPDEISLSWIEAMPKDRLLESAAPTKGGFGSRLLKASVRQLNGSLESEMTPSGFQARLRFPV